MPVKHVSEVEAKAVLSGKDTTIQVLISSQEGPHFAMSRFVMQPGGECRAIPIPWNTSNKCCVGKR